MCSFSLPQACSSFSHVPPLHEGKETEVAHVQRVETRRPPSAPHTSSDVVVFHIGDHSSRILPKLPNSHLQTAEQTSKLPHPLRLIEAAQHRVSKRQLDSSFRPCSRDGKACRRATRKKYVAIARRSTSSKRRVRSQRFLRRKQLSSSQYRFPSRRRTLQCIPRRTCRVRSSPPPLKV